MNAESKRLLQQGCQVKKKFKRPNLAISSFKNPEKMKKRPTKGQISFKNL